MANTGVSHGEVKSICDSLECSPSQHDKSHTPLGKPSIKPGSRGDNIVGAKTGELKHSGVPGYKGKMAKGATQE